MDPTATPDTFDYIVVGGGTAGAVIASRLSEDRQCRVALIEAGGSALRPQVLVPGLSTGLMGHPRWDWCHRAEPDASRGGRVDVWPAGKVLGGGSSINGMVYLRGHRDDYDAWERLGAAGWSYRDCLPYFVKCEANGRLRDEWHGRSGPLSIVDLRVDHPLNHLLIEASENAGFRRNDDVNGADQEGVGPMQTNQRGGMRHGTARAYLQPAARRGNLRIITQAVAHRVVFEEHRAVGVVYERAGTLSELRAAREVIVCAGSMGSPKLLLLSGIGPRAQLERHGVTCRRDMPGVGANLQEHPGVVLEFAMRVPTMNRVAHSPWRYVLAALQYLATRRGPASSPVAHVVGFLKTDPALPRPDVQLHFAPFSHDIVNGRVSLARSDRVGVAINVCRPESRGRVALRSADAKAAPLIEHPLLGADADLDCLMRGARLVQRIFASEPLASACIGPVNPGPETQRDDQWREFLRARAMPMFHPVGTCRIGLDAGAVVDPALRVRGVQGLRVADASVMPALPAANTNGPTIMVAEKAADLIRSTG
jgi:choline dehydrogenase